MRVGRARMGNTSVYDWNRGVYTPLTDFNAARGVGFALRRFSLYLCSVKIRS